MFPHPTSRKIARLQAFSRKLLLMRLTPAWELLLGRAGNFFQPSRELAGNIGAAAGNCVLAPQPRACGSLVAAVGRVRCPPNTPRSAVHPALISEALVDPRLQTWAAAVAGRP